MTSASFSFSKPMVALLERNGITTATPVQKEIIPLIQEGHDVIAQSETGSGKTLSFALPLIETIRRRDGLCALVLAPTRELVLQIAREFMTYSQGMSLGITPVYGGASIGVQIRKLQRTNIVVATPGRLIDLLDRGALTLSSIRYLVLDEADRMLDMGFVRDIEKILAGVPAERQTLLLSATMPRQMLALSGKYMRSPKHVRLASEVAPDLLQQTYYQAAPEQKFPLLLQLLRKERSLALVFCNRKHVTQKLARQLSREGIQARCLNGNMSQSQRERTTTDFRQKRFNVLVATDVAARGLHIDDISHVYNFDIPMDVESYTHRVGRTARAGRKGDAISIVSSSDDRKFFRDILFTYKGRILLRPVSEHALANVAVNPPPKPQRRGLRKEERSEHVRSGSPRRRHRA